MKKILWAIDAFQEIPNRNPALAKTAKILRDQSGAKLSPLYVLSPYQLDVPVEFAPEWCTQYVPEARKALVQRLKELDAGPTEEPQVVVHDRSSLSGTAKELIEEAQNSGADLILLATQARKGLPRLFLGSFTESLVTRSPIPVLATSPHSRVTDRFSQVLFASDLDESSYPAFEKAASLARDLKADLTLLHVIPNPAEPVFQSGVYLLGGGWVPVPRFFEQEEGKMRARADQWVQRIRSSGVNARAKILTGRSSVVDGVLAEAHDSTGTLLAIEGQSSPLEASVLGSVTREVLRAAEVPVYVFRRSK